MINAHLPIRRAICRYFIFLQKALLGLGGWFLLVLLCPELKVSTEVGVFEAETLTFLS